MRAIQAIEPFSPGVSPLNPAVVPQPETAGPLDFRQVFKETLTEVNGLDTQAKRQVEALATGQTNDVSGVMLSVRKANLAFLTLLQVRNKIIDAYDEIMRMRM